VVQRLVGQVAELSRDKFASNVVEEAFKQSSVAQIKLLSEELLNESADSNVRVPTLALLVNDKFGNYVVQTLLDSSTGLLRRRLLRSVSKCKKVGKKHVKHMLMRVRQML